MPKVFCDHFNNEIHIGDYILHTKYGSSSVMYHAGLVLDIDYDNKLIVCKMNGNTRKSRISNFYNVFIFSKEYLERIYDLSEL